MRDEPPKAQIFGGKAAWHSQRVEDNAFYLFAARFNGGNLGEIRREIVRGERLDIHFDQAHKRAAEVRLGCTASIHNHADRCDDTAMRAYDIDCLLHAASASDDVFDHNEPFVRRNLKTAAQNEFAFVFLCKNMAFS